MTHAAQDSSSQDGRSSALCPANGSAVKCGRWFPAFGGCDPTDPSGCILPDGHTGPHRFCCAEGQTWEWETDLGCTCSHCMKLDGDYCVNFWKASPNNKMTDAPNKGPSPER
jgi:hypothetical protein